MRIAIVQTPLQCLVLPPKKNPADNPRNEQASICEQWTQIHTEKAIEGVVKESIAPVSFPPSGDDFSSLNCPRLTAVLSHLGWWNRTQMGRPKNSEISTSFLVSCVGQLSNIIPIVYILWDGGFTALAIPFQCVLLFPRLRTKLYDLERFTSPPTRNYGKRGGDGPLDSRGKLDKSL